MDIGTQIAQPRVDDDRDDGRALTEPLRDTKSGNDVRAARLQLRAGHRAQAHEAVRRLTARLQKALHFPPGDPAWKDR